MRRAGTTAGVLLALLVFAGCAPAEITPATTTTVAKTPVTTTAAPHPAPPATVPTTTTAAPTTSSPTTTVPTPEEPPAPQIGAGGLAEGFRSDTVIDGLDSPTGLSIAEDGRVFIAEKSGILRVAESLDSPELSVVADLRVETYNHWDRGLLGVAADPLLTQGRPYVYVAYSYDGPIDGPAPRWGSADPEASTYDPCPTDPGAMTHGCTSSARVERLTLADGGLTNTVVARDVLVHDWCMQFPSHTIGDIAVDDTGALIVSGGDGAAFHTLDWGQWGSPTTNPCGDPAPGGAQNPPGATGGTLRAQSVRRDDDQPVSLSGSVIRIDADTGAATPTNPAAGHPVENRARIISAGFKNPYRFALRPGTSEIWVGDVGLGTWEEIDRITDPAELTNFGFPCYEGVDRHGGYDAANLTICEDLYDSGDAKDPWFAYRHENDVSAGDEGRCPPGAPFGGPVSSSITGLSFYESGNYPAPYHGALFFADYARECIWVMYPGADGTPDPDQVHTFAVGAATPVQLRVDPDSGDLVYIDLIRPGSVRRISYTGADAAAGPTARFTASATAGPAPLTVTFDATSSSGNGALTYDWDFGDGTTGTGPTATRTFTAAALSKVTLRVTDTAGLTDTETITVTAGGPVITAGTNTRYRVGEPFTMTATAADSNGAPLPATAFRWRAEMRHCATDTNCHSHPAGAWTGIDELTIDGPEHPMPSRMRVQVSATDTAGLTSVITFDVEPDTVTLDVTADGVVPITVDADPPTPGPLRSQHAANSTVTVSAPPLHRSDGTWVFTGWSDGSTAPTRTLHVADDTALTAHYTHIDGTPVATDWQLNGSARRDGATIVLTDDNQFLTGGAAAETTIPGNEFHISYTASLGDDPWGADGIGLVLADGDLHDTDALGAPGLGLGYVGITGPAVIADTYTNPGEPDGDFVGIADGATTGQPRYITTSTAAGQLAGTSRNIDVAAVDGTLRVYIDGTLTVTANVDLPDTIRPVFVAATGGLTNEHAVTDISVVAPAAPSFGAGLLTQFSLVPTVVGDVNWAAPSRDISGIYCALGARPHDSYRA